MNPVSSGYADVDGIKLWHEVYGEGTARADPWRMTTIGAIQGWVQPLAILGPSQREGNVGLAAKGESMTLEEHRQRHVELHALPG
jgi:hypothetical protein